MKVRIGLSLLLLPFLAALLSTPFPLSAPVLASERIRIDVENRPRLGPEKAPITIVEFLDFQ